MPRSSRHKSHKQSKHKEARDRSDSDEDSKPRDKNAKEESTVRVSKDSSSVEKRKLSATSREGKDPSGHGNGDVSDEQSASKRRKGKADVAGGDRWNGDGERGDGVVADKEMRAEKIDSDKGSKSKFLSDSKSSKSSKRHESEKREENVGLVVEKEESKSAKIDSKRKSETDRHEKELGRKEISQYKELKEKEKERGSEKDRKVEEGKRDKETRAVDGEVKRKQGSQSLDVGEERHVKKGTENTECPLQDEFRNRELEKELEKRIKRRGDGSSDKDKYQDDIRESDDRRVSSRGEHDKDGRDKDGKHKDGSYRDKHRDDFDRDNRHRDGKQREDFDREKRHRDDKYRDERASRDRPGDKSDAKHLRDESDGAESHYKKSRNENTHRDGSPIYDDRSTRYKDDKGRRRSDDKEDKSDLRSRSVKEQRSDVEKKSTSSGKAEPVTDRGRSNPRHADVDSTLGHSRRRSSPSPSSHVAKDQYRYSKQADSKCRDLMPEDRVRQNVTSTREVPGGFGVSEKAYVPRSMDKSKDDSHLTEFSVERCPNSDIRASPMHRIEKSPSSSSIDRRHLNRTGVRRSLDVEESGQRSGGSKDAKDHSGNEGKGSRDLRMEAYSVDELSQADGDNSSVSSPFSRTSHLPSNSKSLLPPPLLRAGIDSPSVFGPSDDDNRGKLNNRLKRVGESNMGRAQGNAWKSVPNWPSPITNGFIPFQHGPPPVGFHPMMHQFSAPPMFGVRPSMELNHTGVPYNISDADRFSGHGRPFGWRNPVDESCPPPLHGWDAHNGVVGDNSHIYGRLDWDHNRTVVNGRGWEANVEVWKGQNGAVTKELPSAIHKEDSTMRTTDEIFAGESGQQVHVEQSQLELEAESSEVNQPIDALAKDASEAPKAVPETKPPRDDDASLSHVYLSKLDISADLTHPELYSQCTGLMDVELNTIADDDTSNFVNVEEVIETRVKVFNNVSRASPFAAINDSVFQRAISLYKKQREEMTTGLPLLSSGEKVPFPNAMNLNLNKETAVVPIPVSNEDKQGMLVSISDQQGGSGADPIVNHKKVEMPIPFPKSKMPIVAPCEEAEEPNLVTMVGKLEEPIPPDNVDVEVVPAFNQEASKHAVEDKVSSHENVVQSASNSPGNLEGVNVVSNARGDHSANRLDEQKLVDTACGTLLFSNVSSGACEAVRPELVEFGSVNLSRIHHSPESTH